MHADEEQCDVQMMTLAITTCPVSTVGSSTLEEVSR